MGELVPVGVGGGAVEGLNADGAGFYGVIMPWGW